MDRVDQVERGREAFSARAWSEAHALLLAADQRTPLAPEDVERLGVAAYLLGWDGEATELWSRSYQEHRRRGEGAEAARCAAWLSIYLVDKGEVARGAGWLARARTLLADGPLDCAAQGYVLLPEAFRSLAAGELMAAAAAFEQAAGIGRRFADPDLVTLAGLGLGSARMHSGATTDGMAMMDEVMVAVTSGEVSPMVVGIAYCAVIAACHQVFDVDRAREWTAALTRWCATQSDLVPFRGQCLVHRAEILQIQGAWGEAMEEAERAYRLLSAPPGQPAVGMALYRRAELHRLRGEFAAAEESYRRAGQAGHDIQPGLALLRLAQGRVGDAAAAIRRVLDEAEAQLDRARPLAAFCEIALSAQDLAGARTAADELAGIAVAVDTPLLHAAAAHAQGAVLLAAGEAAAALPPLRRAWAAWQALAAPYEAARTRVLIGLCCRLLGDEDTARIELDGTRRVFRQLGALPDARMVGMLAHPAGASPDHLLTGREVEVLRLVAAGKTNRAIAAELFISERTVDRHLSNIFSKLAVATRTAAAAYAYEHRLL